MEHYHGNHVKYEWQISWCGNGQILLKVILEAALTHSANLERPLVDEEAPVSSLLIITNYIHGSEYYNT